MALNLTLRSWGNVDHVHTSLPYEYVDDRRSSRQTNVYFKVCVSGQTGQLFEKKCLLKHSYRPRTCPKLIALVQRERSEKSVTDRRTRSTRCKADPDSLLKTESVADSTPPAL